MADTPWRDKYEKEIRSIVVEDGCTRLCEDFAGNSYDIDFGEHKLYQNLSKVILPNTLTAISSCAFCGCRSLASVTIPYGVKNIVNGAFKDCSSLTSVILPDGVYIDEDAFDENTRVIQGKA